MLIITLFFIALVAAYSAKSEKTVELWRLTALRDTEYPTHSSLGSFEKALKTRHLGLAKPVKYKYKHEGIHEGVGYLKFNYTAELSSATVQLDEFFPLFQTYNASFVCAPAADGAVAVILASNITGGASLNATGTSAVLDSLLFRLSASGAM